MAKIVKSALITSDNKAIINHVVKFLSQHDFSVLIVKSSFDSILKILKYQVDLFLVDLETVTLEDIDFIKILKKIRPRLPIIILTEDNSVETIRELTQAGSSNIVLKPLKNGRLEQMFEAIDNYYQVQTEIDSFDNNK